MNLTDLTNNYNSSEISNLIRKYFRSKIDFDNLNLKESKQLAKKTNQLIVEFKKTGNIHNSHKQSSYSKLVMLNEGAKKRVSELSKLQESQMKKHLISKILKESVRGNILEKQIKKLPVSEGFKKVLRNKNLARSFMMKVVESRKTPKRVIKEGEIEQAQTTMAAQDIADRIQDMIGKFADIKYKELPALHDNIRDAQGVEAAQEFNETIVSSLDELTAALEEAKKNVDNAVYLLTGEEMPAGEGDLDLDNLEGDEEDLDLDLDDEDLDTDDDADNEDFDLDYEEEDEDLDLGRKRRE